MANLVESNIYPDGIYQIEDTDPVKGGVPDLATKAGVSNISPQQLANRTNWLKIRVDTLVSSVVAATSAVAGLARFATAAEANIGIVDNVAITPLRLENYLSPRRQNSALDNGAGKLLTVGAFGDDKAMPLPGGNVNAAFIGGRYFGFGGDHPTPSAGLNPFPDVNGAFTLSVIQATHGDDGEYISQEASLVAVGSQLRAYRSRARIEDGWTAWQYSWSSENSAFVSGLNGFQRLPSGLIQQWGSFSVLATNAGAGGTPNPFPMTFPNTCWQVVLSNAGSGFASLAYGSKTAGNFRATAYNASGTAINATVNYIALGN